jgi:hypothetical protein
VRVGLVELSVIIVSFAREVDDVADVIAELRLVLGAGEMIDHLLRDIVLRGAVLYAAGIADDVKHHPLGILDRGADIRKVFRQIVVIGRQSQRPRQRLEAGVAVGEGVQRGDALVRLRMLGRGARTNFAALQGRFRGMSHGVSPWLERLEKCGALSKRLDFN